MNLTSNEGEIFNFPSCCKNPVTDIFKYWSEICFNVDDTSSKICKEIKNKALKKDHNWDGEIGHKQEWQSRIHISEDSVSRLYVSVGKKRICEVRD